MNKEKINICFSSDDNFVPYLGAAITSILKNANEEDEIYFYIIDNDISLDNKNKLLDLKVIKPFNIIFRKPAINDIKKYTNWVNISKHKLYTNMSAYFRLSIPNLFPEVDKILYLDCDLVVLKSLKELFSYDIDNYLGIVADDIIWNYRRKNPSKFPIIYDYLVSIGLDKDTHYFNSGVILINNKLWRKINIEKLFEDFQLKYGSNILYADQCILNYVLKDKVKFISSKWNFAPYLDKDYYPILPNVEDICIIHYAASKPWDSNCIDKFFVEQFWKYFCLTPYFQEDIGEHIEIMINQKINALDNKINNLENINNNKIKDLECVNNKINNLEYKIDKLIDALAWWIPIKKWRDNFRNKFFDKFIGGVNNGFKFLYPLNFRLGFNY